MRIFLAYGRVYSWYVLVSIYTYRTYNRSRYTGFDDNLLILHCEMYSYTNNNIDVMFKCMYVPQLVLLFMLYLLLFPLSLAEKSTPIETLPINRSNRTVNISNHTYYYYLASLVITPLSPTGSRSYSVA